jgi:hypothetical protein
MSQDSRPSEKLAYVATCQGGTGGPCTQPDCEKCWPDEPSVYDEPPRTCSHCGKELEDFSDLGCSVCDQRHPNFGVMP